MIRIICVGKIKEKYLKDAIEDYKKRISKYQKIEIVEVLDSDINSEKDLILKNIGKRDYVITMEIEGNNINSLELAQKIDKTFITNNIITFIIGGSEGLHEDVKKIANYKLSFSKMTFPHGLFRLILLEQIYRTFKILNHETYHK